MATIYPLDHIKTDQAFYVEASRDMSGNWRVNGQLTPAQYTALIDTKHTTEAGIITFKHWTKEATETTSTGTYTHQLDRLYVTIGERTRRGFFNSQLGYIAASEHSSMTPDNAGNIGTISTYSMTAMTEEAARAIAAIIARA